LNEAFTCATPDTMFLRSRRRTRVASLAMLPVSILQARPSLQALGMGFFVVSARLNGRLADP
jgi:hypothetical protein